MDDAALSPYAALVTVGAILEADDAVETPALCRLADTAGLDVRAAIAAAYEAATGRDPRPVTPDAHTRHNEPEQG